MKKDQPAPQLRLKLLLEETKHSPWGGGFCNDVPWCTGAVYCSKNTTICVKRQKTFPCIWRDNRKNNLLQKITSDLEYCGMRTDKFYHKKRKMWLSADHLGGCKGYSYFIILSSNEMKDNIYSGILLRKMYPTCKFYTSNSDGFMTNSFLHNLNLFTFLTTY
jgi:hypothetical protein